MSKSYPDARPTWFRLSEDSWAQIAEEYKNGATAAELGAKWKVSTGSVYRHASQQGWSPTIRSPIAPAPPIPYLPHKWTGVSRSA